MATARATNAQDEEKIRAQLIQEMGSPIALNRWVRQEVRCIFAHAERNNPAFAGVPTLLGNGLSL